MNPLSTEVIQPFLPFPNQCRPTLKGKNLLNYEQVLRVDLYEQVLRVDSLLKDSCPKKQKDVMKVVSL